MTMIAMAKTGRFGEWSRADHITVIAATDQSAIHYVEVELQNSKYVGHVYDVLSE